MNIHSGQNASRWHCNTADTFCLCSKVISFVCVRGTLLTECVSCVQVLDRAQRKKQIKKERICCYITLLLRILNPLNAELNPICHLLVLLGDLKFMGPYIVSIFQYISNKMQRYTVYLYVETALHVSGGTSIHHQERIHLYLL
jgi:hypothetical protein